MDEFKQRFEAAKSARKPIEGPAREIYKFCFNGRESEWDARSPVDQEPEEIFTDVPSTVAEDFHGELFSTMTPENAPWVEYEAGSGVEADDVNDAEKELSEYEMLVAKAIRASNYYDEGSTAFQDAVVGTIVLWVDRPRLNGPAVCEAIPLPQVYLRLGPSGVADRFRRTRYYTRDLQALFPEAKWPKKLLDKFKNAKSGKSTVIWGFWPTFTDPENPVWRQEIRVDDESIGLDKDLEEIGAMPMLVGRFNAIPGSPWGRGPGYRMLPTMRVLNAVAEMSLEGMDRNLDPAFTYPHDGLLDLEDGIESGIGYPAMPGSGDHIRPIGLVDNLDYGFFSEERLEAKLRDGFYREVEQRGKTPPSASQFIGQEQKQLRRIARPAAKTWREIGVGLLKRIEFLEREPGGVLDGLKLPLLDSGVINARPISPLERAQAREDVLIAQSILDMATQSLGAEQAALVVDGPETMKNIKQKLKDKLVNFRDEAQVAQLMQQIQGAQNGENPEAQ